MAGEVLEVNRNQLKAEMHQPPKSGGEEAISLEKKAHNYGIIRKGFLGMDNHGRCNTGGACKEAFEELKKRCGDPASWNEKDMARQDIKDLVLAYRTFGILRENKPLIPEEAALLEKLLNQQQQINTSKDSTRRNKVVLLSTQDNYNQAVAVAKNQGELNSLRDALDQGIFLEQQRYAQSSTGDELKGVITKWGEPGTDMSPQLTASIVYLYDYSLKMTGKDRASIKLLDEPVTKSLSLEEQNILLHKLFEELKKAKALLKKQKEDIKARSRELSFVPNLA